MEKLFQDVIIHFAYSAMTDFTSETTLAFCRDITDKKYQEMLYTSYSLWNNLFCKLYETHNNERVTERIHSFTSQKYELF